MIWTILGVSVAVVAAFCITVAELFVGTPVFEMHRPHIAIALGICGGVLWFFGRYLAARRTEVDADGTAGKLFVLFDLRYWGPMLVVFGVITVFIQTLRPKEQTIVHARTVAPAPQPPPAPEPKPEPVVTNAPVIFPRLKLQGVILKSDRPLVIIDGQGYAPGEMIQDVTVKQITRDGVVVEKQGELRLIKLGDK